MVIFPIKWEPNSWVLISLQYLYSLYYLHMYKCNNYTRWRHKMETFSALLVICAGNSPVFGQFLSQRPVTRNFDVFFVPRLTKRLSKHWRRRRFETRSGSLWRHCKVFYLEYYHQVQESDIGKHSMVSFIIDGTFVQCNLIKIRKQCALSVNIVVTICKHGANLICFYQISLFAKE